jgi:hypothetical protein
MARQSVASSWRWPHGRRPNALAGLFYCSSWSSWRSNLNESHISAVDEAVPPRRCSYIVRKLLSKWIARAPPRPWRPVPAHPFQGSLSWLGIEDDAAFIGEPQGNPVAERFMRIITEQYLWSRLFEAVDDSRQGVAIFIQIYNDEWLIETPRRSDTARGAASISSLDRCDVCSAHLEWGRCADIAYLIIECGYPPKRLATEVQVPRGVPDDLADIVVFEDDRCSHPYLSSRQDRPGRT